MVRSRAVGHTAGMSPHTHTRRARCGMSGLPAHPPWPLPWKPGCHCRQGREESQKECQAAGGSQFLLFTRPAAAWEAMARAGCCLSVPAWACPNNGKGHGLPGKQCPRSTRPRQENRTMSGGSPSPACQFRPACLSASLATQGCLACNSFFIVHAFLSVVEGQPASAGTEGRMAGVGIHCQHG